MNGKPTTTTALARRCQAQAATVIVADGWNEPVIFAYTDKDPDFEPGDKGVFHEGKEFNLGKGDWIVKKQPSNGKFFVDVKVADPSVKPKFVASLLAKTRAKAPLELEQNLCLESLAAIERRN